MARIEFPFERDRDYSFAELRTFLSELRVNRQNDPAFSAEVRCNRVPWAKVYNEEIVPIALLADQKGLRETDTFRLTAEGDPADIVLGLATGKVLCQITVADPTWPEKNPKSGSGYVRSLRMELLREGEPAFGGRYTYKKNGTIVSEPHARDVREDYDACRRGLFQAFKRKQGHDGSGYALLIYARGYRFQLIDFDLSALVSAAVREFGEINFRPVWVVDDKFFWELV